MNGSEIPYHAVVEPQEYEQYAAIVDESRLLVTPHQDKGVVPTRNWIWDYAQSLGVPFYWSFDDNIRDFHRLNNNIKARARSGTFLLAIEDLTERYDNLAIAGMQYELLAPRRYKSPPVLFNTRIYSNMLIKTDIPYRFRGFYNEDTDLCLQILKDGWCTALLYAFLANKMPTMKIKGGNTPNYHDDGRWKMARELQRRHPDVVKITRKWGRWQHQVDYRPFKGNRLVKRKGVEIPEGVNDYGMKLVRAEPERVV